METSMDASMAASMVVNDDWWCMVLHESIMVYDNTSVLVEIPDLDAVSNRHDPADDDRRSE